MINISFKDLKEEDIQIIKGAVIENSVSVIAECLECKNVMPIDAYYREMERAERQIYLINVLNGIQEYHEMKFYEFDTDRFGYYALIGSSSSDSAIEYYEEVIGELTEEEKESVPVEISKDDAKNKFLKICKDNQDKHQAIEQFSKSIYKNEPYLILMDGSLL